MAEHYSYEIQIVHKGKDGNTKFSRAINGPHDAELLGLSDKLHAKLTHLDPSSTDPRKV
jgi:hypothetical protein